ncbi:hypothetical protein DdX_17305 [Ditylenchus destructor]|uniref:Uncharacterized protein n=1 Tax=Ditylenchus destructor TaxID=166010 RepID=A0AAD4MML6_9BILA|nr:hypothetical protein DdX_17305 [Ditylenchus destructor]
MSYRSPRSNDGKVPNSSAMVVINRAQLYRSEEFKHLRSTGPGFPGSPGRGLSPDTKIAPNGEERETPRGYSVMDSQVNGSPNPIVCGFALFICTSVIIVYYLHTLVAVWRVSKTAPPFILFFGHGCGVVGYLLNVDWLALEIIFGKELPIPAKVESLVIRVFDHIPTIHFFVIAMSRCFAVFLPFTYNKLAQNRKFFSQLSLACLVLAIVTSFVQTFCVGQMSDDAFPIHNIHILSKGPKRDDAEGVEVQMAMEFLPLIITACGIFFYIAAVIRMLIWRLLETKMFQRCAHCGLGGVDDETSSTESALSKASTTSAIPVVKQDYCCLFFRKENVDDNTRKTEIPFGRPDAFISHVSFLLLIVFYFVAAGVDRDVKTRSSVEQIYDTSRRYPVDSF